MWDDRVLQRGGKKAFGLGEERAWGILPDKEIWEGTGQAQRDWGEKENQKQVRL